MTCSNLWKRLHSRTWLRRNAAFRPSSDVRCVRGSIAKLSLAYRAKQVILNSLLVALEATRNVAAMLMRVQQPINKDLHAKSVLPAPHDRPAHGNSDLDA